MATEIDESLSTRLRDLTVAHLKHNGLFRNASWRLLADFVDHVGGPKPVDGGFSADELRVLVVVEGTVSIRAGGGPPMPLEPGAYLAGDRAFDGHGQVEINGGPIGTAVVFRIVSDDWPKILNSFGLVRSLVLDGMSPIIKADLLPFVDQVHTEFLWVALSDALSHLAAHPGDVSKPLVQILVAAASRVMPQELILNVVFDADGPGNHRAEFWRGGTRQSDDPVDQTFIEAVFGETLVVHMSTADVRPDRVFFHQAGSKVPPIAPASLPRRFRAVFLHDEERADMAPELVDLFVQFGVLTQAVPPPSVQLGLYGSLLSASLRKRPKPSQATPAAPGGAGGLRAELRESLGRLLSSAVTLLERRHQFRVVPLATHAWISPHPLLRVERDFVRASLDVGTVIAMWNAHDPAQGPFAEVISAHTPLLEISDQVARAVVLKRVGIAVSGGGASALRIGPLLETIKTGPEQVPVDLFSGVSGGALVGAYYCAEGMPGVARLIEACQNLQGLLLLLPIISWPLEAWVDTDLVGYRVEDLTLPEYLPVTTELVASEPPRGVCVVAGTLGEAVRASGSLPVAFGPTEKNHKRYTDGAAGSLLPCRLLRGKADVILGCNAVPGPRYSDPWGEVQGVRLVHDRTPVGRLIDAWTWTALLLENATRDAGLGADVFLDFRRQKYPMREPIAWGSAQAIVSSARTDPNVPEKAHDLFVAWSKTGTSGP